MYKNILIVLGLLVLTACSQNKLEPEVKEKVKTVVHEPVKLKVQTKELKEIVVEEEFIPEHLKHSKIEVVKHY